MSLVEVTIKNNAREKSVTESGEGVFCWIAGEDAGAGKLLINGRINWLDIARHALLAGMPKMAMIKALLFGARAKITEKKI